jgi:hypothetical protein
MSDCDKVESQLGTDQMWNINKAFMDQQITQRKTFVYIGSPAATTAGCHTKLELDHLVYNGYVLLIQGGICRAVKK